MSKEPVGRWRRDPKEEKTEKMDPGGEKGEESLNKKKWRGGAERGGEGQSGQSTDEQQVHPVVEGPHPSPFQNAHSSSVGGGWARNQESHFTDGKTDVGA